MNSFFFPFSRSFTFLLFLVYFFFFLFYSSSFSLFSFFFSSYSSDTRSFCNSPPFELPTTVVVTVGFQPSRIRFPPFVVRNLFSLDSSTTSGTSRILIVIMDKLRRFTLSKPIEHVIRLNVSKLNGWRVNGTFNYLTARLKLLILNQYKNLHKSLWIVINV